MLIFRNILSAVRSHIVCSPIDGLRFAVCEDLWILIRTNTGSYRSLVTRGGQALRIYVAS